MFGFNRKKISKDQYRRIAVREYNRARKRFSRHLKNQRERFQTELNSLEKEKNRQLEEERIRVENRLKDLDVEKNRWLERNDMLRKRIQAADEEITNLKEARAQMEAAFSLVTRAISLANSATDEIGKSDRRLTLLKKISESD